MVTGSDYAALMLAVTAYGRAKYRLGQVEARQKLDADDKAELERCRQRVDDAHAEVVRLAAQMRYNPTTGVR